MALLVSLCVANDLKWNFVKYRYILVDVGYLFTTLGAILCEAEGENIVLNNYHSVRVRITASVVIYIKLHNFDVLYWDLSMCTDRRHSLFHNSPIPMRLQWKGSEINQEENFTFPGHG